MKKKSIFLSILLGLLVIFISCGHEEENPWSRFYSYTGADIIGTYSPNPDESAYEESPTPGVVVYDNATVTITDLSDGLVMIRVVIPDKINKVFSGSVDQNSGSGILLMRQGNYEEFHATVYKNSQGQVRLEGYESRTIYNADGEVTDKKIYGFDVIKAES